MEHAGRTPIEALKKMKSWYSEVEKVDPTQGVFYVREYPSHHPMRRFKGCYVRGEGEQDILKNHCRLVDGVHVLNAIGV